MSRSSDPSYYEVALTSRQVAAGFVILLACLVAAFFSGVWVGRSGGQAPPRVAAASPAAPEAAASKVPELPFFSAGAVKPEGEGGGTAPADEPAARTPKPAADAGATPPGERRVPMLRSERQAAREAARQGQEESSQAATAGDEDDEDEVAAAAPKPVRPTPAAAAPSHPAPARPAPAQPAQPLPAQPAPAHPAAAGGAAGEVFVVQVLSSRDQEAAAEVLSSLQDGGYPATLSTTQQGEQVMYRVRVGPYRDRAAAEKVADEVRHKFKLDTWITAE
jgi:cell division septation protein DedD